MESYLKTVTGATAPIKGKAQLHIALGTFEVTHDFWVAEITDDCILGLDFMMKHDCQVNIKDSVLRFNEEEIPLQRPGEFWPPTCYRVVSGQSVTVPPNSEFLMAGTVVDAPGNARWGLVEPAQHCAVADLAVGKTLVELQRTSVAVRVMNLSEEPRTITKGALVASCVPVDCVRSLDSLPKDAINQDLPPHMEDLYERSSKLLTVQQRGALRSFLIEYSDFFSRNPEDLGRTDMVKHHIVTGDALPIRQPPRRQPWEKRKEANIAVETLQEQGLIEPSDSPWASPIVLVRKKGGTWRFCVDYRKLSSVTQKDAYPLPRIEDTLEVLSGMQLFSTLDLRSGYWQVELDPSDKAKTAFAMEQGLWQFRVMPFGLCNAPATFERLMDRVLAGLPLTTALVYIDDILVPAKTFEHGIDNLRSVFERLRAAKLKLSPEKCSLSQERVTYLGHVISYAEIATDPSKIEAVRSWPRPFNSAELRSFLGLCSYYRRFVLNFADVAQSLYAVVNQKSFTWTVEAETAFRALKTALISAPILGYPKQEGQLIVDTDASNFGVGAVLSQIQDGQERVLAYYIRVLSPQERNCCVTRREILAVVKGVQHFHHYLYGRPTLVRTDHAALRWLFAFRHPEGQLARWLQRLQEYDLTIQYRPGAQHLNADAMSRRPCIHNPCRGCDKLDSKEEAARQHEHAFGKTASSDASHVGIPAPPPTVRTTQAVQDAEGTANSACQHQPLQEWTPEFLRHEQREDPDLHPILGWKEDASSKPAWAVVAPTSTSTKTYWAQWV